MTSLWREVALKTMTDTVRAEYREAFTRAVLKNGVLVEVGGEENYYGWHAWGDDAKHIGRYYSVTPSSCELTVDEGAAAEEDQWDEFEGTFYEGDTTHHGAILRGVSCACGKVKGRTLRWEAEMQTIAEAVFQESLGNKG